MSLLDACYRALFNHRLLLHGRTHGLAGLFILICQIQHNQGLEHLNKLMQTVLEQHLDQSLLRDLDASMGSLKAQQTTLLRLLHHKFGKLPKSRRQQLMQAGSRQLSFWSLRVLDSLTLDDVFAAAPGTQSD